MCCGVADSVLRGNLMTAQGSRRFLLGALFRGYLGCHRAASWAFGRWVTCGFLFVAVDAFHGCLFCLQSPRFGRDGASFLAHGTGFVRRVLPF